MLKYNLFLLGLGAALFSSSLSIYAESPEKEHSVILGAKFNTVEKGFSSNGNLYVYLPEPAGSGVKVPIVLNKFLLIEKKQFGFKEGDKIYYAIDYKIRGREAIQNARTCDGSIMLKKGDKNLKSIGLLLTPQIGKEFPFSNTAPWFDCKLVPVYE